MSVQITASLSSWYDTHSAYWLNCSRCGLCQTRENVCLYRGRLPAPYLIIGEAPGPSENQVGVPFVDTAPAGEKLDSLLLRSGIDPQTQCCITNIVGCYPPDPEDPSKFREPSPKEAEACRPRLRDLAIACKPRLVICLGKTAARFAGMAFKMPQYVDLAHPSYLCRLPAFRQEAEEKRWLLTLKAALVPLHLVGKGTDA